jgi:predicted patatin/cPLA2 family phospholipase
MPSNCSVRTLMMDRARSNSKRGSRTDNFHLALVVECGGMRGVAGGGFMKVLSEARLQDSFDTLHGSSAGACAAAFFMTQQSEQGVRIFHEDICTRKIVNLFRFLSQPCMVDTDYIVDEIISKKRNLESDKIISAPGVLNIVTTSILDGLPAVHNSFENKDQLLRALKATLRVPGPFEYGIEIDGKRHLDGGLVAPISVSSAIDSGATHVLVVGTQRTQDYTADNTRNHIEAQALGLLYGRHLKLAYLNAHVADGRDWTTARDLPVETDFLVRPKESTWCGWFTIDKETLRKVEAEAETTARIYLGRGDNTRTTANGLHRFRC